MSKNPCNDFIQCCLPPLFTATLIIIGGYYSTALAAKPKSLSKAAVSENSASNPSDVPSAVSNDKAAEDKNRLVTTAKRHSHPLAALIGNTSLLDEATLSDKNATHMSENLAQSAGSWLSRGNGQESLLAIRSPVLTGAGSCAEFLFLDNGIPLRASGFCNVNQLFDTHFEVAARIEVVKGANSARYGSNALFGAINVIGPRQPARSELNLTLSEDDYYRLDYLTGSDSYRDWQAAVSVSSDGGWQESSGYKQQKLSWQRQSAWGDWQSEQHATLVHLNQETAGYLQRGENAYRDRALLTINDFDNAYRNNLAARYSIQLTQQSDAVETTITPYWRWNQMDFLMHFLPGTPVEENGHYSLGVIATQQRSIVADVKLSYGFESELTNGFLQQSQATDTESDSAFLREVLPRGQHYDYQVKATSVALFTELDWAFNSAQDAFVAVRFDHLGYQYDNRMLAGNTRDDGSECGFGGCRYTRPADRNDKFNELSLATGWSWQLSPKHIWFVKYDHSFRAPHTAELYRLQNGQQNAAIKPVNAEQLEFGSRFYFSNGYQEIVVYRLNKQNGILQDSERQYINGLDTAHQGIEFEGRWRWRSNLELSVAASYAIHRYKNNPSTTNSIKNNAIDTAPRWLASALLNWTINDDWRSQLEITHLDSYYLNETNSEQYRGHTLVNLRGFWTVSADSEVSLSVHNLFDTRYAERADFAFGNHRYFVGRPTTLSLRLTHQF